jgi:RNA polymerase sigma-70 factor (ECF subfamily)
MGQVLSAVAPVGLPEPSSASELESSARGSALGQLVPADAIRFREMLTLHLDFIWRCLRRMGVPPGDCEDAAQQVFLVAASKVSSVAPGSERAFLFATASRIAANARRSLHRREEAHLSLVQNDTRSQPTQEDLTDQLRARSMMDAILREMPDELREVFVLFELEELPVAEVAELLSIPLGTVGSRLRRAREDFQGRVKRWKIGGTPARGAP